MVIVDEKCMQPPPPYASAPPPPPAPPYAVPPPFPTPRPAPTFAALPAHILLQIVYSTFPRAPGPDQGTLARQRKTLYWLAVALRLVNRAFYIACMHVLRSTYLPAYESLIRPPYSSDPFPLAPAAGAGTAGPITTAQRETAVLDLFVALKVREDVWADDSELHLEREESFKDLFDLNQPRSRLEDLVRLYGVRAGVVAVAPGPTTASSPTTTASSSTTATSPSSPSPPTPTSPPPPGVFRLAPRPAHPPARPAPAPLPFAALSVAFSPRRVGLVLAPARGGRRRTIVDVARARDERLEVAARALVRELRAWLAAGG